MPSRTRRLIATAVAATLGLTLATGSAVTAQSADQGAPVVERISGGTRFATAAAVAGAKATRGAPVFVANGMDFPDALAGAPAAAKAGASVLLVQPDGVPAETGAELTRLAPERIHVLGGPLAVSEAVAAELATHAPVVRHGGDDRYATATAVSAATFAEGAPVAYVAAGDDYPDALTGAVAAGRDGGPVLLTDPQALPEVVETELRRLEPARIVVLGGQTAVSAQVETALKELGLGTVTRLAGGDRYATAAAVASTFTEADRVYVASGASFADALVGAAVAGRERVPLLLVDPASVPEPTAQELRRLAPRGVTILGGPLAVGAPVERVLSGAPAELEQWRGLWVDGFHEGVFNAQQVSRLVADATALGANALVVQVGRRFDCFCNNALYPRTDAGIAAAPYDPLAEVIDQAHAAGLEVHAWINATTLWNSATAPTSPDHAFNTHGLSAQGSDRWLNKRHDGVEQVGANTFIDPANPAAVSYVVDAVGSITSNYDVDGVNLDYIRYPDYNSRPYVSDWGYSETSLARFAIETGRTDRPAPDDTQFSDWRRAQVTGLVQAVYQRMSTIDPTDRLSVNAVTYGRGPDALGGWQNTRPFAEVLQDWRAWLSLGIVDQVSAMNYKRDHDDAQAVMFTEWNEALVAYRAGRHVVSGPALYLNSVEGSLEQAREVVGLGLDGWQGYAYANVSADATASPSGEVKAAERARLFGTLRGTVFSEDAEVPAMTWKPAPASR